MSLTLLFRIKETNTERLPETPSIPTIEIYPVLNA